MSSLCTRGVPIGSVHGVGMNDRFVTISSISTDIRVIPRAWPTVPTRNSYISRGEPMRISQTSAASPNAAAT